MRLQQMLFMAFASTILLIGCSKPVQSASTENQAMIYRTYQIKNNFSDSNLDLSKSLFYNQSGMMPQNNLSYTDQLFYLQRTSFSGTTSNWFYSLKMATVASSLDSPIFFAPTTLTKIFVEPFYQKIKVMINGESTILNC